MAHGISYKTLNDSYSEQQDHLYYELDIPAGEVYTFHGVDEHRPIFVQFGSIFGDEVKVRGVEGFGTKCFVPDEAVYFTPDETSVLAVAS